MTTEMILVFVVFELQIIGLLIFIRYILGSAKGLKKDLEKLEELERKLDL